MKPSLHPAARTHLAGWTLACLMIASSAAAENENPAEKPGTAEKHDLAYKFKPGETVRWQVVHRATIKSTIQGTSRTAKTKTESIKVWRIDEVSPEGEITFTHLVDRVKMTNQISGQAAVSWDSAEDKSPPPGYQDAAKAVGVPLTEIEMDRRGEVLERKEQHIQPAATGELPITIPLPAEPVPVGHVWSEPHEVRVMFKDRKYRKVKTRRRFELVSVKTGVATIEVDYQILTPLRDKTAESQLVQRLSGGTIRFDVDAGRIIEQELQIDKRVHDFSTPGSLMHYLMRMTEEILPPEEQVANRPSEDEGRTK